MEDLNPVMREVVRNVIEQHGVLISNPGGERQKYAVIVGRRMAVAAGMLREDDIYQTMAGMRVIINEYTASVEVVREG